MSAPEPDKASAIAATLLAVDSVDAPLRDMLAEQLMHRLLEGDIGAASAIRAILSTITDSAKATQWSTILKERLAMTGPVQRLGTITRDEIDLLILTVKKAELTPCLRAFGFQRGHPTVAFGRDNELWMGDRDGVSIAIGVIGNDGNAEAAIELGRIAALIDFKAAVLVGMAAGVEAEIRKGDVAVASAVLAYEFVRLAPTGPVARAKTYSAFTRAIRKFSEFPETESSWAQSVANEIRASPDFAGIEAGDSMQMSDDWVPDFHTGIVLAGSRLIEDDSMPQLKDATHDRVIAAEMEGAGFAAAADALDIPWLVVRGIADYGRPDVTAGGELRRGKSWQFPSTYAAACIVRDFVVTRKVPLLPDHGGQ